MASLKPLIMRANRLLGASLVEQGLVSIDDLDEANERLGELVSAQSNAVQVSLLSILISEKQALDENALLESLVEEHGLGLIDVRDVDLADDVKASLDSKVCWATLTVPFDQIEDMTYLATSFYLSPAVRTYWEERVEGDIVWFATSLESVTGFLENFDSSATNAALGASN